MKRSVVAGALALVVAAGSGSVAAVLSIGHARASVLPVTNITVNGSGTGRAYDGIGAVLGGGGNARYLMDYPAAQRDQILDYLFKPGFGASLQLLKLEIGGGTNSSDGSEPSVEPAQGDKSCGAGYEFAIAKQAVALDPSLKLYGLQWSAPGWVGNSVFTAADRQYLLHWLNCARRNGLTISYLGGWNERDTGTKTSRDWFSALRAELDNPRNGFRNVQLVAGDSKWIDYDPPESDIGVLGAHDICEFPTGEGSDARCAGPELKAGEKLPAKPLWASEIGGEDSGAQASCVRPGQPCAQGMVRALVRGYHDARLTGYLEWPVLDAMPAQGLPYEDRGLVTADQPWSGNYSVNALTWATAQFTQFAWPKSPQHLGWRYVDSGTGLLQGNRSDGSYVTLVRSDDKAWSTIIETTGASADQNATFTITGGAGGLGGDTVHVWASDFNPSSPGDSPSGWFQPMPHPVVPVNRKFTITLRPGWVYSLTTTTGQQHGTSPGNIPPSGDFKLPYDNPSDLADSGPAGPDDDEPQYLAAQDGSFVLKRSCALPDRSVGVCTEQTTRATPVFWQGAKSQPARYPYAIIGDQSLANYTVSVQTLLTQPGTSAGLIGRFSTRNFHAGYFDGYVFDVSATGAWRLIKNNASARESLAKRTVAHGQLAPLRLNTWHLLSMSLSGNRIVLSVDTHQVVSYTDKTPWRFGLAGLEAGAFTHAWPQAQYSDLSIT